jgi:hypothetical protein
VYTLGLLIPCFNHVSGRDSGAVGSGTEDVAMILSLGNSESAGEVSIDDPGGLPSRDVWHGSIGTWDGYVRDEARDAGVCTEESSSLLEFLEPDREPLRRQGSSSGLISA